MEPDVPSVVLTGLELKQPSATVAADTVIAQLPTAGESVPKTYPVLLLVSLGPPQASQLPASQVPASQSPASQSPASQ